MTWIIEFLQAKSLEEKQENEDLLGSSSLPKFNPSLTVPSEGLRVMALLGLFGRLLEWLKHAQTSRAEESNS